MAGKRSKTLLLLMVGFLTYMIGRGVGVSDASMIESIITGILVSVSLAIVFVHILKEEVE